MIQHSIVYAENGGASLTAFFPGQEPIICNSDHPSFEEIKELVQSKTQIADYQKVRDLVDVSEAVGKKFSKLSERVSVSAGNVFFDGDPLDNAVADHIIRCLKDDSVEDYEPVVHFLEKIYQNPNNHSREQLYSWLQNHNFELTTEGDIIAYKGVKWVQSGALDNEGVYHSINSGPAIIDGEKHENGPVPNKIGSIIEVPRSYVDADPKTHCSKGLHVATHAFAKSFGGSVTLKVLVNPRDVVSVPDDGHADKVRVCRYKVLEVAGAPGTTPIDNQSDDYYEDDDYYECDYYGDDDYDGDSGIW